MQGYAARDSRAMSDSVGGYPQMLPELPGEALCCAAGMGEVLLGLSAPGLAGGAATGLVRASG